jgi:hypothetical protein
LELRRLLKRFEELDTNIWKAMRADADTFGAAIDKAWEAKLHVKRWLGAQPATLRFPPDLIPKLKKVRSNCGYAVDAIREVVQSRLGKQFSPEAEGPRDAHDYAFWDNLSDEQAAYIGVDFLRRRNEAATIIAGQSFPEIFLDHLARLRECYPLGLFEPAVVYCRALIESGCFEALKRRGEVSTHRTTADVREYRLKDLMRDAKPLVRRPKWDAADKVIELADRLLHSKREKSAVSEAEALGAIKTTYALIEELFG